MGVTATVSFPSDMGGVGQQAAVQNFQNNVAGLNAGKRRRSSMRRLLQAGDPENGAAEVDDTSGGDTALMVAVPDEIAQNPLTTSLADFGLTVAPEQTTDTDTTNAAVGVPVNTDKNSVESASSNEDLIGAQVQAKAAEDVTLPTPGEVGVSVGETKTVDVPEAAQEKADDIIDAGTGGGAADSSNSTTSDGPADGGDQTTDATASDDDDESGADDTTSDSTEETGDDSSDSSGGNTNLADALKGVGFDAGNN